MCCDRLCQPGTADWPEGLDEKIRTLDRTRRINPMTRDHLDQLRRWGNAAAHPEDSLIDEVHQQAYAGRALASVIALLETVFQESHHGAALPAYEIIDQNEDALRETCYRALIENNPADQYQVAALLRTQLDARIAEAHTSPDPELRMYSLGMELHVYEDRRLDLLRYASDSGHAPSQYQYGLALTKGHRGKDMVMLGVNMIAMACRDGEIDALAWCGQSALRGWFDEPVDYVRARELLQQAAAEDHPAALSSLSEIYRDGLGVEPDAAMAFSLTLRAANAGYALAQYETAVALMHGKVLETDEPEALKWLRRASDAGLPRARYALARILLDRRETDTASDIESLLVSAAVSIPAAHLDLAELYISGPDHAKWVEAAGRIQAAYEQALGQNDSALAQRCLEVAPPIIAKLEAALPAMSDSVTEEFIVTRFMFDDKKVPYPSRAARGQKILELTRALSKERGTASKQKLRLLSELGSNMGGLKTSGQTARSLSTVRPFVQRVVRTNVGRNDPCPCGSGKKYKQCHA